MRKKLILVDGNSIINRAFFGLGPNANLTAPDGRPTGAVLTFFNILLKHLSSLGPTHLVTAFDRPEPTFRHRDYAEYKAKRTGMPEELAQQMPILKSCLEALGLSQIELAGYEADDLIGTLARHASEAGMETIILTGDKDSFQLIRDDIHVLMPGARASLGDKLYDRDVFHDRYGIQPEQFIDVKAIMGDSSDNIPGVKGIGEKGALELISAFNDLDSVYEHIDELKPAQKKKLSEQKEMAYLSRQLATIDIRVPVEVNLDLAELPEQYDANALNVFRTYGFNSLIDRLHLNEMPVATGQQRSGSEEGSQTHSSFYCELLGQTVEWPRQAELTQSDMETVSERLNGLEENSQIACAVSIQKQKEQVDGEVTADPSQIDDYEKRFSLAVAVEEDKVFYVDLLTEGQLQQFINRIQERSLELVGYDLKSWLRFIPVSMKLSVFDIQSSAYLMSLQEHYADEGALFAAMSNNQAGHVEFSEVLQLETEESPLQTIEETDEAELRRSLVHSAFWSYILYRPLRSALEERKLLPLALSCDMPLVVALSKIEQKGILVDKAILDELKSDFTAQINSLETEIYEMAGREFTINSPKQLGDILFVDLGLPSGRKGKSGQYSTAQGELDRLRLLHPVIDKITDYRQLTKLRSTFIEGLSKFISQEDGRIHSHFNANYTNTGRLSSKDPNLQNIPVRQAVGREIRKAFVAAEGHVLLDADYSQIELRLLAEMSGDASMIEAYRTNVDIHTLTASRIFHVPVDEVTGELRSRAKTINFSIVYGISDFGLSQRLELTVKEAHQYIENYYAGYPAVRPFMEEQIKLAKERGYSETLLGRRRYIPELASKNRNLRQFGERVAMNSPVQGTAADIIRVAMVSCSRSLEEAGIEGQLISQVHDELIVEVKEKDAAKAAVILQESMEKAISLSVPMVAEVSSAKNWFDAKG